MIKYPLFFKAAASSESGIHKSWTSGAGELLPIQCAIPVEFQGPGDGYSPEDLMAMTVINCFIATFKVFAERSGLTFDGIEAEALLEINRDTSGKVGVTNIQINVLLKKPSDSVKAEGILAEAKKNCLMANALKASCEFKMRTI